MADAKLHPKDIQITYSAMLKSVIESGAKPEEWQALTQQAYKIWHTDTAKLISRL